MKLIMKKDFNWFYFILILYFGLFLLSILMEAEIVFTLIFLPIILCLLIARIIMNRRQKTQPGNMHTKKRDIVVMIIVLLTAGIYTVLSTFRTFFKNPTKNEIGYVSLLYGPIILLLVTGIILIILRMKKNPWKINFQRSYSTHELFSSSNFCEYRLAGFVSAAGSFTSNPLLMGIGISPVVMPSYTALQAHTMRFKRLSPFKW